MHLFRGELKRPKLRERKITKTNVKSFDKEHLVENYEESKTETIEKFSSSEESLNSSSTSANDSLSGFDDSFENETKKLKRSSLHASLSEGISNEYSPQKSPCNTSSSHREASPSSRIPSSRSQSPSSHKSPYVKNKPKLKSSDNQSSYHVPYKIISTLPLLLLVLIFMLIFSSKEEQKLNQLEFMKVDKIFTKLRLSFPKQSDYFWNALKALIGSLLSHENSNGPTTFLLAVEPGAETTVVCFIQQLSFKLQSVLDLSSDILINIDSLAYKKDEIAKVSIHDEIEKDLQNGKLIALVDHIESLKADDVMIFHGLCDTVSAHFKKAIYFLLYHIPEAISHSDLKSKLRNQMHQKWVSELGEDAFASLMTRLSTVILPFTVEENFQCTSK